MNINIAKKTPSKTRRYHKNRRNKGKQQMSPHKFKGELFYHLSVRNLESRNINQMKSKKTIEQDYEALPKISIIEEPGEVSFKDKLMQMLENNQGRL